MRAIDKDKVLEILMEIEDEEEKLSKIDFINSFEEQDLDVETLQAELESEKQGRAEDIERINSEWSDRFTKTFKGKIDLDSGNSIDVFGEPKPITVEDCIEK